MLRKTLIIIPTSFEAHKHSQQFLLRESCLVQFFKIYAKLNHFEGIQFSGLPWFSAAHLFCLSNKLKKNIALIIFAIKKAKLIAR